MLDPNPTYRPKLFAGPCLLGLIFFFAVGILEAAEDPLVNQGQVIFQGRFRVPTGSSDAMQFDYGGQGLGFNPINNSLFIGCHDWYQRLGEVSIPTPSLASSYDSLPQANVLQGCSDVTEGSLSSVNPDGGNTKLGGNLVYNNRLITSAYTFYDGSCRQNKSHGASSNLDLSQTGNFSGFFDINSSAISRAEAGYMTTIPLAWQNRLGGPALTGLGGVSIISCASSGLSATVFDPDDVGNKNPIPGTTLIDYPDPSSPIVNQYFHWLNSTSSRGIAFPEGSRSVIFIGSRGDNQCYGVGTSDPSLHEQQVPGESSGVIYCYDECGSSKGTHSYPYRAKMWAYDALDLEAVKTGQKAPDSIEPYAMWDLAEMGSCSEVRGATYDPASGMVFITPSFGSKPVVYVYKIEMGPMAPQFTMQPSHQTVAPGQSATFTVGASGNPTPAFQWQKNNVNIMGATNPSYTISAVTQTDNGSTYRCVVTNSLGSVTSNAVTLTVASGILPPAPPPPSPSPSFCTWQNPVALPAPAGSVVNVSNTTQLINAVNNLQSNQTLMMAAGTYNINGTLFVPQNISNWGIRGATGNRDDVVINGNGSAQFGFWIGSSPNGTIADLTIDNISEHSIIANPGAHDMLYHNLRLVDAGDQFLKSNPNGYANGNNNGIVECSVFEYRTTESDGNGYTNGVDVHGGADWIIRHNLFKNILHAPGNGLAGPSILMWNGSRDTVVEGNTFINVARGISLGLEVKPGGDHIGGVIKNNFIYRDSNLSSAVDVGIHVADSPNTKIYHNTVILNGTYPNAIEYRFGNTINTDIQNNLVDGNIVALGGATGSKVGNVTNATPSLFVNAPAGDLHLKSGASVINQGSPVSGVTTDIDGQSRDANPDIGADEFGSNPAPPPTPSPSPTPPPSTPPPSGKKPEKLTNILKNSGSIQIHCEIKADIINKEGNVVRQLPCHGKLAEWDGRNDQGELVSAGIYFYRYLSDNEIYKVIVLK